MATTPYGSYATTLGLSALSIGTSLYDQRQNAKAISDQSDRERESMIYTQNMTASEVEAIDRELSMVLSANEISALKDTAMLTAVASSTGLSGNITSDIIAESTQSKLQADTQIVSAARSQQSKLLSKMVEEEISFKNKLASLNSSLLTPETASLQTLGAGLSGFQQGLGFLSQGQKNNLLGI